MKKIEVNTVEQLDKLLAQNDDGKNLILLFSGTKKSDGKSWCPDCVVADPVIEKVANDYANNDDMIFASVSVGDLPSWKSSDNAFRKHSKFNIKCVPTLINISKNMRLEEATCADESLVKKLFDGQLTPGVTYSNTEKSKCVDGVCRLP